MMDFVGVRLMRPDVPPASRERRPGPLDLRESGPFLALARGARKRDELDRHLRQALPIGLRDRIRLADLRDGSLVFLAPSPAWASRLRLAQAQILAAARAFGTQASSVRVKVVPPAADPVPEPPPRAPLSRSAARHLEATARSLSDPVLRDLFLALASAAETPPGDATTD